jgi:hypothetical protein
MYIFFHLFTGIVLGLLFADFFSDRRWVIPCAIGAVLPDLIDKPVGQILFAESIGYGRIYGHTLLFFVLVLVAGLVVWKYRRSPFFIAIAVGILSHEVLDQMWHEPANWCWPFLGPLQGHLPPDYFLVLINGELSDPFDILIAILLVGSVILYIRYRGVIMATGSYRAILKGGLLLGAWVFLLLAGIVLGKAAIGQTLPLTSWTQPEQSMIGGIVFILAAYVTWRLHCRIPDDTPESPAAPATGEE